MASLDVIEADVLVVGGGIAGCVAATRAAEAGASVVLVDKVRSVRRSGDAGRGLAFLTTYLDLGEEWDTPAAFARWYCDIALGLVDMSVAWPVAIDPLPDVVAFLEESGVPLRNAEGGYDRVSRMWTPGPIVLKFDGEDIKPRLTERAEGTPGVRVVGGVHITSVQRDGEGRAVGATGFDVRSCEFVTFRAGAVVIATGNAERVIFNSPRRDPFNTYHRPYHGATGFALAARAGAAAANIEFLGTFLFPRGFATGAMGNLLEAGGRLVNGNGDLIAGLPDVEGRQFGHGIVAKAAGEARAGRGPIYIDCTHLSPAALADITTYISYDAPLFREFLEQSGIDLARHPVEFELFNGAWSATGSPKGVVVDGTGQTATPGLFAAGDLSTPAYALAGSLTSGWVTGDSAARFAREAAAPVLDRDAVARERSRTLAPLDRRGGTGWREFERELQDLMTKYVGMDRNEIGLRQASAYLSSYADAEVGVGAAGGHELMRAHEAFDLRLFDEMMAAAALERDETRFSFLMGHHRTDRPDPDDETWTGVAVLASHDGDRVVLERTVPTPEWREQRLREAAGSTGRPDSDAGGLAASAVPTRVVRVSTPAGKGA
ncbi:FAD-dependent oxidoreductase [Phytohabitans kaempferiae]|uniref:FAD-dependent oxidoreductase n=1 Tax=Phytohabitans kaempferiae TaxID=1620943 RepID=A0ABV6LZS9_9ACTN